MSKLACKMIPCNTICLFCHRCQLLPENLNKNMEKKQKQTLMLVGMEVSNVNWLNCPLK